jgi:hypothetical protein
MLTREHAETIANKLKGERSSGSKHELVKLVYDGKLIGQFGIRRGSRKDQGHDFIPAGIHLSMHDTISLARCNMTYEEWIERMKEKGFI